MADDKIEFFDIYYEDLTAETQKALCKAFNTTSEEENWDMVPLAVFARKEEPVE